MGHGRIGRDGVLKVARLARLELEEGEVEAMTRDLGAILDAFSSLLGVGVEPGVPVDGAQVGGDEASTATPLRPDIPHAPARRSEVFAAAPATRDGGFQVPKVVEK